MEFESKTEMMIGEEFQINGKVMMILVTVNKRYVFCRDGYCDAINEIFKDLPAVRKFVEAKNL